MQDTDVPYVPSKGSSRRQSLLLPDGRGQGERRSISYHTVRYHTLLQRENDGWRARILVDADGLSVGTRSGRDITANVHGLDRLANAGVRLVLDGELVVGGGRLADFYKVGPTLTRRRPVPGRTVAFAAFDVLWLDGALLTGRPQAERPAALGGLGLVDLGVAIVPAFEADDAAHLLRACAAHGVEGVVLKLRSAPYLPRQRSPSWRKFKCGEWAAHRERRRPG